jgi:glycosyltransferase involved in cell wall biosynthesis
VTNGIDDEFITAAPTAPGPPKDPSRVAHIVYAGNIGEGQALHQILPELAKRLEGRAKLTVIGDGGRWSALASAVAGLANVELRPPVGRAELLGVYASADVLFLHLGSVPAFEKVLPSKLFEYAALGKPILAGVAGYAAEFVGAEIDNAEVFAPGDVDAALRALARLELRTAPRPRFVAKFARSALSRELAADVLRIAAS